MKGAKGSATWQNDATVGDVRNKKPATVSENEMSIEYANLNQATPTAGKTVLNIAFEGNDDSDEEYQDLPGDWDRVVGANLIS